MTAAFGFAEPGAYYLYNSAIRPRRWSNGLRRASCCSSRMPSIDRSPDGVVALLDFLKGAEDATSTHLEPASGTSR